MTVPHILKYQTRDNAGIKACYSINFTCLEKKFGRVLASITRCVPGKKFKKGDLIQLVTTGHRRGITRKSGITSKLAYNGVIAVKKDGSPIGTRIYGALYLEARVSGYSRLAVVSKSLL